MQYWYKQRQTDQGNDLGVQQIFLGQDAKNIIKLIFGQHAKSIQWRKESLFPNGAGTTVYILRKKMNPNPNLTPYVKLT